MTPIPRFTPTEPFRPMPGLAGAHSQTVLGSLVRRPRKATLLRERWTTPDGDFLDVDILEAAPEVPHVLVLHGLEGSSNAGYVREILRGVARRGWGALALNFRSCSGEPNRVLKSYNSGDISDATFALERLRARGVTGPLFGVGFSLGGSVLLNVLARTGDGCPLSAGAAISVPFDLDSCAHLLDAGGGLTAIYRERFLRTLKEKSLEKTKRHPGVLDPEAIRRAQGIRAFDAAVTARLFGFASAEDYYAQCSAAPRLPDIRSPT
ncbi:MAG: alpha/beta fold hydrolase, partial [Myxococcaceae bacterium]